MEVCGGIMNNIDVQLAKLLKCAELRYSQQKYIYERNQHRLMIECILFVIDYGTEWTNLCLSIRTSGNIGWHQTE